MMKKFMLSCFALCAFAAFAEGSGPRLVPDYNRDGVIDPADYGRLAKGEAFTVWINDDDDAEGAGDGKGDTNTDLHDVPGGNDEKDCEDEQVNGRCDLLDFFPVLVDVHEVEDQSTFTWKLCGAGVNVVFTPLTDNTAGDFHTKAIEALDGKAPLYRAAVTNLTEDGVKLPENFLQDGKGVFVFEGSATNDVEMMLCGFNGDGACVCSSRLNLAVKNVESFYGWMNLRDKVSTVQPSTFNLQPDLNLQPDNRHFVLVHGYNTNHEEARGNAAEFYKKLWQSGSDAMFTAVEWKGDQSQMKFEELGITFSPNYHVNVENAFAAARPFAEACNKLPGEKIVVGHSLGNMLISSAIKDYGLDYTKYVMLNAAVAREAYDASAYDEDMVSILWTDEEEVKVRGEGEDVDSLTNHLDRASRWYRNFADRKYDPYEYRRKLAWRGRFANLPRTVNYYSPTDNVLKNPAIDDSDDLNETDAKDTGKVRDLLGRAFTIGGFWSLSEKLKGRPALIDTINHVLTNVFGMVESDVYKCEGGWGENDEYVEGIPFSPTNMHFTPFLDPRMKTIGMLDILPAETERVRAQHLADAIPAESFAAGANPVATLGNVNMESFIGENEDWPLFEGGEGAGTKTNLWNHSAFREVAFYHTSKFYASLAAAGKPRVIIGMEPEPMDKDALFTLDLAERMVRANKLGLLAVMTNGVEEAVVRYRDLLRRELSEGRKVVICSVGSPDVLKALLESTGDDASILSGTELVEKTVKELRVVDEAVVPEGWPTKVVVTGARPDFYESEGILADFPAGTLSPTIREAELNNPSGVQLAGPMAALPLVEGEPITNQTAAAILGRLREIYRAGNPSVSVVPISPAEPGVDYNGSVMSIELDGVGLGRYSIEDLRASLTVEGEVYEPDPGSINFDELGGVLTFTITVPPEKVTAGNEYDGEVKVSLVNDTLGENVLYKRTRKLVQGRQEQAEPTTDWFNETNLEAPTNYVPASAMPERCLATVEATFLFEAPVEATDDPPATNAVQGAVRIVADGADGYKFQYYACVGKTNEDSFVRGWWDFNVGGEDVSEIKPVLGKEYTVRAEAYYFEDARGEENTLVVWVGEVCSNQGMLKQFVGNIINRRGGQGGTTRLNSVEFLGDGEISSLVGNYYTNVVNATLAKIDGDREYATVSNAVAAADGQPVRLLHAASWKPAVDDIDQPVKFLNKSWLHIDLSGLPENVCPVWTDVDGNDGTLTLELVYADTVVYGTIRTAETNNPIAEAIAIKDGKYVSVGDATNVAAFVRDGVTEVIDHRKKGMVMPGCTDGHSHYAMKFSLANIKGGVLFTPEDNKASVLQKLETAALEAHTAGKTCLYGFGWNFLELMTNTPPTLAELDEATHGVSTVIFDQGGHHTFCNSECLKRCGIIDGEGNVLIKKIDGGLLELDDNGYPTGYAEERVTGYLTRMGGINADELVDEKVAETALLASRKLLLSTGYTIALEGWSNTLHPSNYYAAAKRLDESGKLTLVFPMTYEVEPWQTNMTSEIEYLDWLNKTYRTSHVLPEYLKIFMDGVVETRTGAMLKPYKPDEQHPGGFYYPSFWSVDRLAGITAECNAKGLTVHVHTMGDAAVRDTVSAYIQGGDGTHRNCLVHLRNVSTNEVNDFERMARNNIACTAGFTWHMGTKDDDKMEDFLDREYVYHAYPMKSFFDAGVRVSSHTDFPANAPSPQDPFGIMEVAVTGQRPDLPADEKCPSYDPNELVTREQAFQALTLNGAWQVGLEDERGSITVGKWADFVLVDQDVFECETTDIHKTKVISTWFEGKRVYQAENGSEDAPWKIGATTSDNVIAYTNGVRLVVGGTGSMKDFEPSAPWAGDVVTECIVASNVTTVGANAFAGCPALKTLVLYGQTPPALGAGNDFAAVKIFVPAGKADAYRAVWPALAEQIDEMRSARGENIAKHLYEVTYKWWDAARAEEVAENLAGIMAALDWVQKICEYFFPYQVFDWYKTVMQNTLCTSCRNGNFVGRNFDWGYDDVDECVMHVPAAEGRFESVGVTSRFFPQWMQDAFGVDEFLPALTMDGINEKGVAINVNVVPGGDNGWTTGTNSNATKRLCAGFAVRTVLDNATNAAHAVEILQSRDIYSLKPLEFHWMISDLNESYIVECVSNALVVLKAHDARPKMSNFYVTHSPSLCEYDILTNAQLTADFHTPHAMGIERYANVSNGLESVDSVEAMFTHMTNVWYKLKYLPGNEAKYWSDMNGAPVPGKDGERFEVGDEVIAGRMDDRLMAFGQAQANYVAVTNYEAQYDSRTIDPEIDPTLTNQVVHTVHTSIYDLEKHELVVCVQEDVGTIRLRYQDEPYAPVPVTPGAPATYDTQAMAEKAANRAVFTPSAEVETKLGKGSDELQTYCGMFDFAVTGGDTVWSVAAVLRPEAWTEVSRSAQEATRQIPVADIAAMAADGKKDVKVGDCVPGFYYTMRGSGSLGGLEGLEGLDVYGPELCGKDGKVLFPEVKKPSDAAGFFTIGAKETKGE